MNKGVGARQYSGFQKCEQNEDTGLALASNCRTIEYSEVKISGDRYY